METARPDYVLTTSGSHRQECARAQPAEAAGVYETLPTFCT